MIEGRGRKALSGTLAAAIVMAVATPRLSLAQEPEENGIGCGYMIMVTLRGVAEACFPGDRKMLEALDRAVEEYDAFMLRNDPNATPQTLETFKNHHGNVWRKGATGSVESICERDPNGAVELYLGLVGTADPQRIVEMTAEALAVDQRPTMNPCL